MAAWPGSDACEPQVVGKIEAAAAAMAGYCVPEEDDTSAQKAADESIVFFGDVDKMTERQLETVRSLKEAELADAPREGRWRDESNGFDSFSTCVSVCLFSPLPMRPSVPFLAFLSVSLSPFVRWPPLTSLELCGPP